MIIKDIVYTLRPSQWIKNLFIFLPLVFGHQLLNMDMCLKSFYAFLLFSLIASVVYIINDIIDIDNDKLHPTKSKRPLASGKLGIKTAIFIAVFICLTTVTLSFLLNTYFALTIIFYLILNLLYSVKLKEVVIIDVFALGGFFLLRIAAGTIIANVSFSYWMIFMTVLLALFLGFNKRRQELRLLEKDAIPHRPVLKRYGTYFIDQMIAVITSSIVVAYMLYTVDIRTVSFVGSNHLIYSIPFVYYGIFRYLYLIHKLHLDGDPTQILIGDRKLKIDIILWLITCVCVIYFKL